MTPTVLADVLAYLRGLHDDATRPVGARAALRSLQARHPATSMDLVWEAEGFDGSVHYDMLLRDEDRATLSISYCPDRVQPWPLRGVQRWSDQDLLRVNTTTLSVGQAIACLDVVWDQASAVDGLVNVCLIQEELDRKPIALTDDELQLAMDGFRRARRLLTAADTMTWLAQRGMSHADLESLVADQLQIVKLRTRVTAAHVDSYFDQHGAAFDSTQVARVTFASAADAERAVAQLRSTASEFFALADQLFRAGRAASVELTTSCDPAFAGARPGEIVGPLEMDGRHVVAQVITHVEAELDQRTRDRIERLLFDRWLADRRTAANIEWNWLNTARTQ